MAKAVARARAPAKVDGDGENFIDEKIDGQ
jgi:hypothetical protein